MKSMPAYVCDWCDTSFCIDVCESDTDLALVITKWINMGAALSSDDAQWKAHCKGVEAGEIYKVRLDPCDERANARVCFENASLRAVLQPFLPQKSAIHRDCALALLK
jgi:hypothetical protein